MRGGLLHETTKVSWKGREGEGGGKGEGKGRKTEENTDPRLGLVWSSPSATP